MVKLNIDKRERTNKNRARILRALASTGQRAVAEAIGVNESTVSRMKNDGDLDRLASMLTEIGLKVVPEENVVISRAKLDALLVFADDYMAKARSGDISLWDGGDMGDQ